jgi:hypothetical protein
MASEMSSRYRSLRVVLAYNLPVVALLMPFGKWVDVQKIIEALERPPPSPTSAKNR